MRTSTKIITLMAILSPHLAHSTETSPDPLTSKPGSSGIYVVGDSISTPGTWPAQLATLTGRHTFSQAIGGSASPSMVGRARGVELVFPRQGSAPVTPGSVRMRWSRHLADRTNDNTYKTQWAYLAKAVSEPVSIEVYQHGRLLGLAKRRLNNFTTDYAKNSKTIFCAGHGLEESDRVAFISDDPGYPGDLSVLDSVARWNFSSPNLPSAIVERRVYFVAHVTPDSFEIKEGQGDAETLDLGSDSRANQSIECGWEFDLDFAGGPWDVTWAARTKYDDRIWLLEVCANDIPISSVTKVTIPNLQLLLSQMSGSNPRYVLICPPSGSFADRGPGTFNWTNYYDTYMPWVRANHPNNHIDTMALLGIRRSAKESKMLLNPTNPERLWITGSPDKEDTWQASRVAIAGAHETWVGPGYLPLQFRASFMDDIHLNSAGDQLVAEAVSALITEKGW